MFAGFREFIARGNAIDLAVGVIIGAAFGTVIESLTGDVISPLIGAIFGEPNFDSVGQFEIGLLGDPAIIRPGVVITSLVNFLIVAFALYFFVIVPMNKLAAMQRKGADLEEEDVSPEVELLTEIRDALKSPEPGKHASE